MIHFKDISLNIKQEEGNKGIYEISPLPRGYGNTLANALRRILLSSLEGGAITEVKIPGLDHEYKALDGVREDVLEIFLNLKALNFKIESDEPQIGTISMKGERVIKAQDIHLTGGVEVMDPEAIIAHLTDSSSHLEMELKIERGLGYVEAEGDKRLESGVMRLDADFSPVLNVSYEVLQARKGQQMNLDNVVLSIETDGSISPKDALLKSSEVLQDFAGKVMACLGVSMGEVLEKAESAKKVDNVVEEEEENDELNAWKVDDLQLSKRTKTSLIAGGYKTVGDLKNTTQEILLNLPGFGQKSFNEIYDVLKQFNIIIESEE